MRGIVLCQSPDVEIVQKAGGGFNMRGKENGGVGGRKGYIYLSSWNFLVQLLRYDNFDSYPAFCWLTDTKWPSLHLVQPTGTSLTRSLETRVSTQGDESLWCRALVLHHTPLLPLRPRASRSTLCSSQVIQTVQPSNTATNSPSGGKSTRNWCHRIENTSLFALRCF